MDCLSAFKCVALIWISHCCLARSNEPEKLVYDGEIAPIKQFPYYASLGTSCGAIIIADRWVLTAAHCVIEDGSSCETDYHESRKIYVGGDTLNNSRAVDYDEVVIHPEYIGNNWNLHDLALLRLSKPLKLSKNVFPIKISRDVKPRAPEAIVVGRGLDKTGKLAKHLMKVDVVRLSTKQWLKELKKLSKGVEIPSKRLLEKAFICAKSRDDERGVTPGDSGGPVVDAKAKELIGIVSFIVPCSNLEFYVNVASYFKWIEEVTATSTSIEDEKEYKIDWDYYLG